MSFLSRSAKLAFYCSTACYLPSVVNARGIENNFSIPSQKLTSAIMMFSRQSGMHVVFNGKIADTLRSVPVYGKIEPLKALHVLLGKEAFTIDASGQNFVVLHRKHVMKSSELSDEKLEVVGHHSLLSQKRHSPVVVDSVKYNDTSTLVGASSVAQLLSLLPGVTGIQDGDEPRFISVRGISPDLNQTTISGITLATIGDYGGGTRRVNLQNVPSEIMGQDDIYKTFTSEQDGGAIGAVIDMKPRSAFDYKGLYKYIDAWGIYSPTKGTATQNGVSGYPTHMGQGVKAVLSDRFGSERQFGAMISFRYQSRPRNASKQWTDDDNFYTASGKPVLDSSGNSVPDRSLGWDGKVRPGGIGYGNYSNTITNIGGAGRLEWRPTASHWSASLFGYSYARWERSIMNHTEAYFNQNSLADMGNGIEREQVNSIYTYVRRNRWERDPHGVIGDLKWEDARQKLELRAGYTWENYSDYEPYLRARAYPNNLYADYSRSGNFSHLVDLSDPSILRSSSYKWASIYNYQEKAREGLTNVRLDYTRNIGINARGFGIAAGFEWRSLNVTDHQTPYNYYKTGGSANSSIFFPNYVPPGSPYTFPWINIVDFPWSQQKLDTKTSRNNDLESFYRYREELIDGYASLHYKWEKSELIAGVRADSIGFTALSPMVSGGNATGQISKGNGGYVIPLPSVVFVHEFPHSVMLHASWSETLGRPMPSQIAQGESISSDPDPQPGKMTEQSVSRGNSSLKPRRAHNFDLSVDKYFDGNKGLISAAFFDKMIKHDIYDQVTYGYVNDVYSSITQPMNAQNSSIMGIEFSVIRNNLHFLKQTFDLSANGTYMHGHMKYNIGEKTYKSPQLIDQPKFILNGSATWDIPQIRGAMRATLSYTPKYLTDIGGDGPWQNSGYGSLLSLNLGFWHNITDHITFKYEVQNLAGAGRTYRDGSHLQWISEKDYYGRTVYFHVMFH
ncbi:TonB-dependent receptor [Acetobacter senegalensis]|uniref:TonB-dependent receptor n=1 Tax=Acetobacter senegalensis TaxID=446692 RepID=UPI00264D37B9|nr:TonB-dependent receptor [Acetobacter senegalensis]MDN7351867.1 TonB-dependent receptor [Acetobacter senegalensis]